MNTILTVIAVLAGVAVLWLVFTYNRLVTLRFRAKEAISDIDVQLKRRYDLIPNLVEAVKGYMAHEKGVLENVTAARAKVASGGDALARSHDENVLSSTLKTLFAVAENYPDLKANANFLDLQRELADTENKIQASRRFYNTTVRDLNTKIEIFPVNLVVGTFGFSRMDFFEAEDEEKEPVQVRF
ncbi:MAG: LemA family protein [Candidatus Niyogibacteria bacterium]|nr:LemA family protein [Candidatus Niyogibacteria bacterium]